MNLHYVTTITDPKSVNHSAIIFPSHVIIITIALVVDVDVVTQRNLNYSKSEGNPNIF